MSDVLELERPIHEARLGVTRIDQPVLADMRMSTHFGKIADVTGRYFGEQFVRDLSSMGRCPEKNQAVVSSWKGW